VPVRFVVKQEEEYDPVKLSLPTLIDPVAVVVEPLVVVVGVVVDSSSSSLEQDEKDIVKAINKSRGIYIFIFFLLRKC
jgi:hypothetical protein